MAEDAVSRRQEHARIPRDHLPQPVPPGAGRTGCLRVVLCRHAVTRVARCRRAILYFEDSPHETGTAHFQSLVLKRTCFQSLPVTPLLPSTVASDLRLPGGRRGETGDRTRRGARCAVTVMAAAKSFFPEDHPQFAGIYWGEVSTRQARSSIGLTPSSVLAPFSMTIPPSAGLRCPPAVSYIADNERVYLDGHDFLSGLARKTEKRESTMVEYKRIRSEPLLESGCT
jgi:hypothetical protein